MKVEEVIGGKKRDPINHPPWYTMGQIEVIDFLEDQGLGYHLGNVVKYLCRARHKGKEAADLLKAQWYLNRYIEKKLHEKEGG